MNSTGAEAPSDCRTGMAAPPLFTVSQWQELEHQSLIFKYLMAGIPVPPDLVLPIQKSFESLSARFYHHPSMAYCSFYGKKVDPEPGRCRRTDGKKWRCSKDAYPDSKYCERHMNRGRNRSRKPVESHTASQSSSTLTSLNFSGVSHGAGNFQNLPLNSFANSQGGPAGSGANPVHINMEPISYGTPSNSDYRYIHGYKAEVGEHSLFEASGSNKGFQMNSPLDSTWSLMPSSRVSSFPPSKSSDNSILQNTYPHNPFFSIEFASGEAVKQEGQSLRPFFNEWPKTRDSWSDLEEERSNQASFSTTQLSMSTPIFPTSSQSLHDN